MCAARAALMVPCSKMCQCSRRDGTKTRKLGRPQGPHRFFKRCDAMKKWTLAWWVLCLAVPGLACTGECESAELLQIKSGDLGSRVRFQVLAINNKNGRGSLDNSWLHTSLAARGGGTRAMAGTAGQLRALRAMRLLPQVDQIVAVSGATWTTAIYLYAPKSQYTDEDLLGRSTFRRLQSLTLAALNTSNGAILERAAADFGPAFVAAFYSNISYHEVYEKAVGATYFCPFGINGELPVWPVSGICWNNNTNQVFAETKDQLKRIHDQGNQHNDLDLSNALIRQRTDVHSFVLQASLLSPEGYLPKGQGMVSVRFSADYSGSPYIADCKTVQFDPINTTLFENLSSLPDVVVGGGVVSSFAFMATTAPYQDKKQAGRGYLAGGDLVDTGVVSLQQASAFSSSVLSLLGLAFPDLLKLIAAGAGLNISAELDLDPFLFTPTRLYWPVASRKLGDTAAREFYLGDGASMDIGGLLEAIRSGASCAVSLLNNERPIDTTVVGDWCNPPDAVRQNPQLLLSGGQFNDPAYDYFGVAVDLPNDTTLQTLAFDYSNNQVFETDLIFDLFCEAQTLTAAGKPAVVYRDYTTIKNKYWGIEAGQKLEVIFVFTEMSTDWLHSLPMETQEAILRGDFDTKSAFWPYPFPYIRTANPQGDGKDGSALSVQQANLYASLTESAKGRGSARHVI
ncbi:unnamed protein product [Effrenium voratum]|uniref:Uncharacterized protein n=1 Tax=Effrenium voratum TaxID=2562239 RepID=A0AA36N269_9DINO|nr:unnamed protein product [Effrenium voratum]